jgi:tetratricopeptide (TPR) repeat protein
MASMVRPIRSSAISYRAPVSPARPYATLAVIALTLAIAAAGCHRKSAADYLAAAESAQQQNKLDAAVQDYVEALKLEPRNLAAHIALARLYVNRSQWGPADEQYRAATALDPTSIDAHTGLATVLTNMGRRADAITELRTVVGLDPQNAQAHLALARLLEQDPARQADAQQEYGKASAIDPTLASPIAAATPAAAPAMPPMTTASKGMPASPPAAAPGLKIKAVNKKFHLFADSPVYQDPNSASTVVAQVHNHKYVNVIGVTGDWLQIKLKNGTVGFIPMKAVGE